MRWRFPWQREETKEPSPASEPPSAEPSVEGEEPKRSLRRSLILFARDVALAFVVVAIIIGAMTAWTQVWPPVVVVESASMQHSNTESFVGVIDTGDIVLVQAVRQFADVTTYVQGRATGYGTYSDYGDVIIFHAPGAPLTATPIIHRAMAYVTPNPAGGADVPSLLALDSADWYSNGTATSHDVYGITEFTIRSAGYRKQDLRFGLSTIGIPGFLTKGDHNQVPDGWAPVGVGRVVGKARGEIPWFGLIKLTVSPDESGCCHGWGDPLAPSNSWNSLLLALIVLFASPVLADLGWSYFTAWREKRRRIADLPKAPEAEPPPGEEPPKDEEPAIQGEPAPAPSPKPEGEEPSRTESSEPEGGGPSGP